MLSHVGRCVSRAPSRQPASAAQFKLPQNTRRERRLDGSSIARQADGSYKVKGDRLNELMSRDISRMALQGMQPFSLRELFDTSNNELVRICQIEGPKRLALRVQLLESLTGWDAVPELVQMHEKLSRWFKSLRLLPSDCQVGDFINCVRGIRRDGMEVVPLVASGINRLHLNDPKQYTDVFLDRWLDGFFLSRIGTNVLADHLVSRANASEGGLARPTGIIDPECDATDICKKAAQIAQKLCQQQTGVEIQFSIENYAAKRLGVPADSPCIFPYIPSYLSYSILEVLKNSFKATADMVNEHGRQASDHSISIQVCRDDQNVAIMISDRAGGIPLEDEITSRRIWSYLYGAAAQRFGDFPTTAAASAGNKLAGFGVGLPLSRLHLRYLGGSLKLTTYPGYGTQAHIMLPRIDADQVEVLPLEGMPDRDNHANHAQFNTE